MRPANSTKHRIGREAARRHPFRALFLWDVIQDRESRPTLYWAVGTLAFGTIVFHWLEGWSFLDALYFCVISLATVGYGDLHPTTPLSRAFTIFYVINGIVILLSLFDRIRAVRMRRREQDAGVDQGNR